MPSIMPPNKRVTVARFSLKTLSAAVVSALLVSNVYAAGLGKLTVLSALGQPLRAEIELTSVSKNEAGALIAKLASAEAFRQANVDFHASLLSLRFNVENRGERQLIRVTSSQPLNEPFVDMLLELNGPNGRLIREYTFLLDPPDLRTAQTSTVAPAVVPQLEPARAQAVPDSRQRAPAARRAQTDGATRSASAPIPSAGADAGAAEYEVRTGDTLTKIATRMKPAAVSLDQMLVALYQTNPDAFIEKNMNRLKAGQILDVPSEEAAAAVSAATARSMIVAQAADFNSYRRRLAGQVETAAAQRSVESRQGASGRISARVEERPTPVTESRDKLQLSNAAAGGAAGTGAEDLIAREKALAEANARVRELEKNVSDLQKLLELKSPGLAEQQKQAEMVAAPATTTAPATAPEVAPTAPAPVVAPVESQPAVAAAPPPVTPKPVVQVPPPPPPPGLIDELLSNPMTLPGLGLLLVVLGGLGIYRVRRQKKGKQFEDSIITDSSLKANSLFGSTGGQTVDTNNSVFNSSFSPSSSQLDSNEVDPVAEADVYIAYGRDAQAEEILKEALRTQPDRHAVRVKLLEIYSNRKDLRAFEVLATELYGLTKGAGDEWEQAAAMGVAIDPQNPLYAGAKTRSDDKLVAPTQPLDEQGLATLLSATQGDTGTPGTMTSLESDTSYFSNTALAEEQADQAAADAEPEELEAPRKPLSNDLDFDLDGMNLDIEVPNTVPRPTPAEPTVELASIDFDFLDTKAEPEPVAEMVAFEMEQTPDGLETTAGDPPEAAVAASADGIPSLDELEFALNAVDTREPSADPSASEMTLDIAGMDAGTADDEVNDDALMSDVVSEVPAVSLSPEPGPMDFDLSDISLELDAEPGVAENAAEFDAGMAENYGSTEMATKLDLAIAYQEIGDKEGARELLDEVIKGGTPEQSEKAKSLLLELA